jgi:hypothetical protein
MLPSFNHVCHWVRCSQGVMLADCLLPAHLAGAHNVQELAHALASPAYNITPCLADHLSVIVKRWDVLHLMDALLERVSPGVVLVSACVSGGCLRHGGAALPSSRAPTSLPHATLTTPPSCE